MWRCNKYQRDHIFPSVFRVQRVEQLQKLLGPQHCLVSPFIAGKDTSLCFCALQRLEAWKPGPVWGEEEPSQSSRAFTFLGTFPTVGQTWQEFSSSWTHSHKLDEQSDSKWTQLKPPTRVSHARSNTSIQSAFLKLKIGRTQMCFRTLMFFS